MIKEKETHRIIGFDSLKGLSIIAVIYYHLFPQAVSGGFLLVNTFLVLSGYFVAGKVERLLRSRLYKRDKIKRYIISTVERLFIPLLWLMILIVVGLLLLQPVILKSLRSDILSGMFFVNNIFQILADRSYFVQMAAASPFTHLWYNALYLQSFLIAVPVIILTHKLKWKTTVKAICWITVVLIGHSLVFLLFDPGQDPSRVYYGIDTRFAAFAAGISLYYIEWVFVPKKDMKGNTRLLFNTLGLLVFTGMLTLAFVVQDSWDTTYLVWMPFFTMLSVLMIHLLKREVPALSLVFNLPFLAFIGKRSYTYYLWYYPIIVFYLSFLRQLNGNILLVNLASLITIAVVGEVFYRVFERRDVIVAYGLTFDFKKEWQEARKHLHFGPKSLMFWGSVAAVTMFFGLFVMGIMYSADNKPLAQFDLERQFYQAATNVQNQPMKEERYVVEVNNQMQQLDDVFQTTILREPAQLNLREDWQALTRDPISDNPELGEQVSQNQMLLSEMIELNPDVTSLLNPAEILAAAQVPVTFFGDSLILITAPDSLDLFRNGNVFGYGSLQIYDASPIMEDLINQGVVHQNVVINLGTNASIDHDSMDELIALLGDRTIFFVNTNSAVMHIDEVNRIIRESVAKHDNVYEIDWHTLQQGNDDWYTYDEVHHSDEGKIQFTALVARELYKVLGEGVFIE